jgi:RimJ/RimL family protein N-acetyltransferase
VLSEHFKWIMMSNKNELNQPVGAPVNNWVEALKPSINEMIGQYCAVLPLNIDAHAESLYSAFTQDKENKNWTYLPYGPFENFNEFKAWITGVENKDDPIFYVVIDKKNNSVVGLTSYLRINQRHGVIEVGHIHYSPLMQRTSMATEVMFLMMQYAFESLNYRRYEWKCDSLNEKSNQAALRLGFSFEGIFRQAIVYKGRNRDTAWYSILDSEWPRLKQAFLLWLSPSNFDGDGQQLMSLGNVISKKL